MLNDEKLIEISRGVDNYLSTILMKYEITPLSLAAVLLARTMVLDHEVPSHQDDEERYVMGFDVTAEYKETL